MAKSIADFSWRTIGVGTVIAALIIGVLFMAMYSPQCPDNASDQLIRDTGCMIGANIGHGLLVMSAPIIWALSVFAAAAIMRRFRK